MDQRIAVIGFGFSGLMVVANLVREGAAGLTIYVIDSVLDARGVAYSTGQPQHLLNVSASRMGAFADEVGGFFAWLHSPEGIAASQRVCGRSNFASRDFVPRMLYGDYLSHIWQQTQLQASEKSIQLKLVPSRASAVTPSPLSVLTERGDAIAIDEVALCIGHEFKPIFPQLPPDSVIQHPWAARVFDHARDWPAPVMLLGTGLTAIDMLLMLRAKGYAGTVVAASRNGKLPQMHRHDVVPFTLDVEQLLQQPTLAKMLRSIRAAISNHGDWRGVLDSLRPHTQMLWQRLSTQQRLQFLRRVMPFWNTHRHRMAPEIALQLQHEIDSGTFQVVGCRAIAPRLQEGILKVKLGKKTIMPSRIIHCVGPELNVARSSRTILNKRWRMESLSRMKHRSAS